MKLFVTIGQIITLLIFGVSSIIAGLDIFGALDGYPRLEHSVPKITLLVIGLIGSGFLIEHWASIRSIENNSRLAAKSALAVESAISNVDQLTHPTRITTNRHEHYSSFLEALSGMPAHSSIDVTHFEKLLGTPFDVGESNTEEHFVQQWKETVLRGDNEVRQIVHVSSLHDLDEVDERLNEFRECLNYSLNVAFGPPAFPYLDMALIKNHWGTLDFSSDAVEPFRAAIALEFRNVAVLESLAKYFDIWWSKFSVPVKSKSGIHLDTLHRLRRLLTTGDTGSVFAELYPEFLFVMQSEHAVRHFVRVLVESAELLHIPAVHAVYKTEFERILSDASGGLQGILVKDKIIDRALVESVLLDALTHANTEIRAVSYDVDQEVFWNCAFGERLFQSNVLAVESISIRRIFLLTREQLGKGSINALLKRQARAGIEIYYACADDVDRSLRRDFLIMDEQLVFEMALTPGPEPVKNGTLRASKEAVAEHKIMFHNLLLKSQKYEENQKRL